MPSLFSRFIFLKGERNVLFGKLIHRWRKWLDWNNYAREKYGPVKRFLIFLKIIHNDWFEHFNDWRTEDD